LSDDFRGGAHAFRRRVQEVYGDDEPALNEWHDLCGRLVDNGLLPTRLCELSLTESSSRDVELRALIGMQIVGRYVLEEMFTNKLVATTGEAQRFFSDIASAQTFTDLCPKLFPYRDPNSAERRGAWTQEKERANAASTIIAAAAYDVSRLRGGESALKQLAKFLCFSALAQRRMTAQQIANPKGLLLELNGETISERVPGTADHEPVFAAEAIWPAKTSGEPPKFQRQALGKSKKAAEAQASLLLLTDYGHIIKSVDAGDEDESARAEKKRARLENAFGEAKTFGAHLVSCENVRGSGQPPLFVAMMRLASHARTLEFVAEADTKKQAVRAASQQLLAAIGKYA
jgi:hypothetical protein